MTYRSHRESDEGVWTHLHLARAHASHASPYAAACEFSSMLANYGERDESAGAKYRAMSMISDEGRELSPSGVILRNGIDESRPGRIPLLR
jgi:hypothetical protein